MILSTRRGYFIIHPDTWKIRADNDTWLVGKIVRRKPQKHDPRTLPVIKINSSRKVYQINIDLEKEGKEKAIEAIIKKLQVLEDKIFSNGWELMVPYVAVGKATI